MTTTTCDPDAVTRWKADRARLAELDRKHAVEGLDDAEAAERERLGPLRGRTLAAWLDETQRN
jgi:hypothetical protein